MIERLPEDELNKLGDKLARALHMRRYRKKNDHGRWLWHTQFGTKTGVGLLRTLGCMITDMEQGNTSALDKL